MNDMKDSIKRCLINALETLDKCKQLTPVKIAQSNIIDAIKTIDDKHTKITHLWCPEPVVVKQPIDLLSDEELLAEVKKRMNRYIGPAFA